MSLLSVPSTPMLYSFLQHHYQIKKLTREGLKLWQKTIFISQESSAHSSVTLELLLHVTPSHDAPHGSWDCPQFGGVFFIWSIKDRRAAAEICFKWDNWARLMLFRQYFYSNAKSPSNMFPFTGKKTITLTTNSNMKSLKIEICPKSDHESQSQLPNRSIHQVMSQ